MNAYSYINFQIVAQSVHVHSTVYGKCKRVPHADISMQLTVPQCRMSAYKLQAAFPCTKPTSNRQRQTDNRGGFMNLLQQLRVDHKGCSRR